MRYFLKSVTFFLEFYMVMKFWSFPVILFVRNVSTSIFSSVRLFMFWSFYIPFVRIIYFDGKKMIIAANWGIAINLIKNVLLYQKRLNIIIYACKLKRYAFDYGNVSYSL